MRNWALLFVVPLTACAEPTVLDGVVPTLPTLSADTGALPPCAGLALDRDRVRVGPLELVQFTASGGTGAYAFSLQEPAFGTVHPTFGSYLAPSDPGVSDTVVLTDAGCMGQATATVDVGDPFGVLPLRATVLPGTAFVFELRAREPGEAHCEAGTLPSGGTISTACAYQAGSAEGIDEIRVVDDVADGEITVSITVDAEASMEVWGHERWVVPLGSTFVPRVEGGSEIVDVQVFSGALEVIDGGVKATTPGVSRVRVIDRFAGFTQDLQVNVVAPFVPDSPHTGQRQGFGEAVAAGDLNGDGAPDVVFGSPEINGNAYFAGAVMVYQGTDGGLDPEPVWVAYGANREEFFGRAVEVADVDGDGEPDLIAGADAGDLGAGTVGLVRIWRGVVGGFFEDEPMVVLRGPFSGDRAGSSLATCDL